jgi:hypothetical protein
MFSIENLAWHGYTSNLIPEEIGNGDPMSGRKGRIMWFPPYDLSFTDNTSVNWEKTDFIGRGEPIYTYNNTTRTGNLQFKIIIDHPSYVNSLKGESDDLINSRQFITMLQSAIPMFVLGQGILIFCINLNRCGISSHPSHSSPLLEVWDFFNLGSKAF